MKEVLDYDALIKDSFERDRPSVLDELTGGRRIRAFLSLELRAVEKRIPDLLILLEDDTVLHIELQSSNHRDMPYRMGVYGLLTAQKYRCRVEQAVLYVGRPRMRMAGRLDTGGVTVNYRLIDIREWDAETLLASRRPGDYALALLARGGTQRIRQIVARANGLPHHRRQRVLAQLVMLAGLRGASKRLTMEFKAMGISVEIERNVFLKNLRDSARAEGEAVGRAEGRAEGKAEGRAEGKADLLLGLLQGKFGELPRWAADRVGKASPVQLERWAHKLLTASNLEGVLGRK